MLSSVDAGKKGVQTSDVVLLSENLGEPRVTNGSDDSGDLSLRDACLGKRRECAEDLSRQPMSTSDAKAAVVKKLEEVTKRHAKQQQRKSTFATLMAIRHIQIRAHPGECSQEQSLVWISCRSTRGRNVRKSNLKCGEEVIDEARNKGRKVEIGTINHVNGWRLIPIKMLQERIQNHLPVQVPSLNAPECSK